MYKNPQNSTQKPGQTAGFIDVHCHCLPGLDDGPSVLSDAIALCRSLVADGITVVMATPHQLGQYDRTNESAQVRAAVAALNDELAEKQIPLSVLPGGDVRLDERICRLLREDKILTLADGGKYILLELPTEVLINIESLITELSEMNITAIISHPERHRILPFKPGLLPKWLSRGACLQITAASLLGDFGDIAQKAAWEFLCEGWVSLVATDSHNLGRRRPRISAAFNSISSRLGQVVARQVCIENPLRILESHNLNDLSTGVDDKHNYVRFTHNNL
jgi:protein-tyrosine phosphatase